MEDGRWKKKTFYTKTSRIPTSVAFTAKRSDFFSHGVKQCENFFLVVEKRIVSRFVDYTFNPFRHLPSSRPFMEGVGAVASIFHLPSSIPPRSCLPFWRIVLTICYNFIF
jgi:hypothetical protein